MAALDNTKKLENKQTIKSKSGQPNGNSALIAIAVIFLIVVGLLFGLHHYGKKKYTEEQNKKPKPQTLEQPKETKKEKPEETKKEPGFYRGD